MQIHYFTTGGFVVHKIVPHHTSKLAKLSAWYDKDGYLLSAEGYDKNHRAYAAMSDANDDLLQALGRSIIQTAQRLTREGV